jgi:hypothetical protein
VAQSVGAVEAEVAQSVGAVEAGVAQSVGVVEAGVAQSVGAVEAGVLVWDRWRWLCVSVSLNPCRHVLAHPTVDPHTHTHTHTHTLHRHVCRCDARSRVVLPARVIRLQCRTVRRWVDTLDHHRRPQVPSSRPHGTTPHTHTHTHTRTHTHTHTHT